VGRNIAKLDCYPEHYHDGDDWGKYLTESFSFLEWIFAVKRLNQSDIRVSGITVYSGDDLNSVQKHRRMGSL